MNFGSVDSSNSDSGRKGEKKKYRIESEAFLVGQATIISNKRCQRVHQNRVLTSWTHRNFFFLLPCGTSPFLQHCSYSAPLGAVDCEFFFFASISATFLLFLTDRVLSLIRFLYIIFSSSGFFTAFGRLQQNELHSTGKRRPLNERHCETGINYLHHNPLMSH